MKKKSQLMKIWALAAAAAAVTSCEITDDATHVDNNAIEFSVAAAEDDGGRPLTRAPQYGSKPIMMTADDGGDTLYLHTSVESNLTAVTADEAPKTRGVPVTTDNFKNVCKDFGVTAYTQVAHTLYMDNEKVSTESGGIWSPDGGVRYWPEGDTKLDFYAHAPYEFSGPDCITIGDGNTMSFSYAVPTTNNGKDAEAQPDVMLAYTACGRDDTDGKGTVPLKFAHALAGVKFVAKDIAGCTIKSITLKGLYGKGECTFTPGTAEGSTLSGTFAWTGLDDKKDFTQNYNVTLNDQQTGQQQITDKNPATTFMMIPQALDGATVEINLTTTQTNEPRTLTGKLAIGDLTEWEAGNIYTYEISTESINWEYVFEVTPTISLPLGGTSSTYNVKSYRYRRENPLVKEPVAWSVNDGGISGTETQYGSSDDHKKPIPEETIKKEVLDDFTYEGKGGGDVFENGTNYKIVVERTDMHTTYKGDEQLKDSLNMKGTPEDPYDLSTEGGTELRTTANCYVVGGAGTYKLPLVYGNAIVKGQTNLGAYSDSHFVDYKGKHIHDPWIKNSGGTPHDCALVWSDGFYMFKDVHLSDDGDYLVFTLDKEYMQQANAILAVRDAQDNIMWSWHIWVIERDINATTTVDDYWDANKTYQIMSCNLGWVDAKWVYYNPRDLYFTFTQDKTDATDKLHVSQAGAKFDYKDIGSTYYQWGRKDPIVALMNRDHTGVNDFRRLESSDSLRYTYKVKSGGVSMATAIQNPNVYYVQPTDGTNRWLESNSFTDKLWNMQGYGTVQTENSIKTIYDPSPKGFKVPVPRAFSVFVNGYTDAGYVDENDNIEKGGSLNGDINPEKSYQYFVYTKRNKGGTKLTFTATGQRASRDGIDGKQNKAGCLWALDGVYYWTCNYAGRTGISHSLVIRKDSKTNLYTIGFLGNQAMARPVRCIKE